MPLKLMKGIRHFKNNAFPQKKDSFDALMQGQFPESLFITCSDSRIIPSLLTHSEPGDAFMIRNVGNIIPPSTIPSSEAAAIEYALKKLKVKEIIVCGHSHCGAMQGLLTPHLDEELPTTSAWLTYAQPALEKVQTKYPELTENFPLKVLRTTKENILIQIEHLKTHPAVKEKLESKELTLHAWLYEIESGEVLIYNQNRDDFISFEDAVTETFRSDYVLKKMNSIVEEEAMSYLATRVSPKTTTSYQELMVLFNQLQLKGSTIIWESIKEKVIARLGSEFGELCDPTQMRTDPRFTTLIEQAQEVALPHLKNFQKDVLESPGYRQFCSQMMRGFFRAPVPQDSFDVLTINSSFTL